MVLPIHLREFAPIDERFAVNLSNPALKLESTSAGSRIPSGSVRWRIRLRGSLDGPGRAPADRSRPIVVPIEIVVRIRVAAGRDDAAARVQRARQGQEQEIALSFGSGAKITWAFKFSCSVTETRRVDVVNLFETLFHRAEVRLGQPVASWSLIPYFLASLLAEDTGLFDRSC